MNIVTDKNNPVCDKSAEEDFCEKKRLFVDMDGTLTEWRNIGFDTPSSEEINELSMREKLDKVLYCPGYFSSLKEHEHVVMAINKIVNETKKEIYYLDTSKLEENEKMLIESMYFEGNKLTIPSILKIEKGIIKDKQIGKKEYEEIKEFIKEA